MSNRHLPAQLGADTATPPPGGAPKEGPETKGGNAPQSDKTKPPPPPPRERRGGGGIAWLALLTALGVAGWNGYQHLDQQRRLTGERALFNEQARRITELERALTQNEAELATRASALEERQRALQEALAGVRTLAGLRDRNGWIIAETEYLVRLAQHTLGATGDAATAHTLLEEAIQRIDQLGDPALHTVRTLLEADIAALKALPPAPLGAHSAALARLMEQVERLPLPIPHTLAHDPAGTPSVPAEKGQWRAWLDEAERWVRQSVVLRRDGDKPTPQVAPAEHYFLTQNLRLTLEAARLALYRDDEGGVRAALRQARQWVIDHFDTHAGESRALLRELARLEQAPLDRPLPDLRECLDAITALAIQPAAPSSTADQGDAQ